MAFRIGTDAEVFLRDRHGNPISAAGIIGGSKEEPRPIDRGALQEDNVMAEFNIEPATDEDTFVDNINHVMNQLIEYISPMQLTIDIEPTKIFPDEALLDPMSKVFGCDPDFNAYTCEQNPKPSIAGNLRTASAHIHLELDGMMESPFLREDTVKAMDLLVGIPMVCVEKKNKRREHYGRAGSYRPKPYGVEYRSCGNEWIRSESLMRMIFRQSKLAVEIATNGELPELMRRYPRIVQDIINGQNKGEAKRLIHEFDSWFSSVKEAKVV